MRAHACAARRPCAAAASQTLLDDSKATCGPLAATHVDAGAPVGPCWLELQTRPRGFAPGRPCCGARLTLTIASATESQQGASALDRVDVRLTTLALVLRPGSSALGPASTIETMFTQHWGHILASCTGKTAGVDQETPLLKCRAWRAACVWPAAPNMSCLSACCCWACDGPRNPTCSLLHAGLLFPAALIDCNPGARGPRWCSPKLHAVDRGALQASRTYPKLPGSRTPHSF